VLFLLGKAGLQIVELLLKIGKTAFSLRGFAVLLIIQTAKKRSGDDKNSDDDVFHSGYDIRYVLQSLFCREDYPLKQGNSIRQQNGGIVTQEVIQRRQLPIGEIRVFIPGA
jgi:hypothetical protein